MQLFYFFVGLCFATSGISLNPGSKISNADAQMKSLLKFDDCTPQSFNSKTFNISIPSKQVSKPITCNFNVESYEENVCHLHVTFSQFQLPSSKSCKEQYLKIGDKKVCGSIMGTQMFPFSEKNTIISYRGDGKYPLDIQFEQEKCKLRSMAKCDVSSSAEITKISTPNYPFPYPTPLTCLYTLKNSPQETCRIAINFIDFNIPESTDCLKGRLLIDGEPYCGKKTGLTIFKNVTNDFSFEFSEGSGETNGAFRLTIKKDNCQSSVVNVSKEQEPYLSIGAGPGGFPLCCNRPFSSPYIVLTSPGLFNVISSSEINCIYQIIRASPQVCRIRLNFIHFWVGHEDPNYGCKGGFLEIDGRRICGCQNGLSFVTYFNGGVKELRYNMQTSSIQGFLIEAVQENCYRRSSKALPEDVTENPDNEIEVFATNNKTDGSVSRKFFVPGNSPNCFQLDPGQWFEKIRALAESVKNYCPIPSIPIIPPNYPINPIIPPIPPPSYPINPIIPPPAPPALPPNFPVNPIIPPPAPPALPPNFPVNPIIPPLTPPIFPPNFPVNPIIPPILPPVNPILPPPLYPVNPIIPPPTFYPPIATPPIILPPYPNSPSQPTRCLIFSGIQGSIVSPKYPLNYPSSLKCCYRIKQAYGYCRVQLIMLDFDVTWSPKCFKDYLLLDGKAKHCGQSLQSTTSYLNFRSYFASVDFVSSSLSFLSGRGFRAIYRQLPCNFRRSSESNNGFQPEPRPPTITQPELIHPISDGSFDLNVPAE